jgi:hypothetical protein
MANPNLEQLLREIAAKASQPSDVIDQKRVEQHLAFQQPPKGFPSPEENEARSRYQVERWEREDAGRPQNTPIAPPLHRNGTMLLYPPEREAEDAKNAWRRRKAAGEKEWYDKPIDPRAYLMDAPINPDINHYLRPAGPAAPPTTAPEPAPAEPMPAPEPVAAPEPAPAPEAPPDDGRIRTAIGDFMVDENGAKIFNERTGRFHPTSMTAFPSEVLAAISARKAAKSAAPDEILDGEDRYKIDKGKPVMFHPKSGSWIEMGSEDLPSMPETVRKAYVDSRSATDKTEFEKLNDAYHGATRPRPEQIEQYKAKILAEAAAADQKLQGISSPEELQVARDEAARALQVAQRTGDAGAIKALKAHADQLNSMNIIAMPEGGYIMTGKANDGYNFLHTGTPKESKNGQYDWAKDPVQVQARAEAMAISENRTANSQAAGGALLSKAGRTITDTFAGRYAKDYRADQLRGEQPDATAPEVLVDAYVKARDAGDTDGMLEAVKEMQEGLASRYGSIYKSLRPSFIAPGTINEGIRDHSPAIAPMPQGKSWDTQTQLLPEKAAKAPHEAPLQLPDILGKTENAGDAQHSVANNLTAQQPTAMNRIQEHKAQLLRNPKELIPQPRTAAGRVLDQPNEPSSLLKVSVEDQMKTDRVFADNMIGAIRDGVAAKVAAIKLATMNTGVTSTTNIDNETSTHVKQPTISPEKEKQILKSMFGSETYTEGGAGGPLQIPFAAADKSSSWSDPNTIQRATQNFLKLPRDQQERLMQQGSFYKTIGMLDGLHPKMISTGSGVAPKRFNGRLEIDSQLGDLAGTEIMNSASSLFEQMARQIIQQNPEYYKRQAITQNGAANYRPQDVVDAIAKNLAQEAMVQVFTPSTR